MSILPAAQSFRAAPTVASGVVSSGRAVLGELGETAFTETTGLPFVSPGTITRNASQTAAPSAPTFVFRGDERAPSTIFNEGFAPIGQNMDLLRHVENPGNPPSIYVSTSRSFDVAADYGETGSGWTQVYHVQTPANAIDVNAHFGANWPDQEVALPYGVGGSAVRGVTQLPPRSLDLNSGTYRFGEGSHTILNPNYRRQ